MGVSVDVWCLSLDKVIEGYMEGGVDNEEKLYEVLHACGIAIPESDTFIILNNEHLDTYNPYSRLLGAIRQLWPKVEDAQGPLLGDPSTIYNDVNHEVLENMGVYP